MDNLRDRVGVVKVVWPMVVTGIKDPFPTTMRFEFKLFEEEIVSRLPDAPVMWEEAPVSIYQLSSGGRIPMLWRACTKSDVSME